MAEINLLSDSLDEQNLLILQSYSDRAKAAKAANEEHDGWLDRLAAAEDMDADQLTRIHGELIALGMLKFELANREAGLRYRISDRGRAALERQATCLAAAAAEEVAAEVASIVDEVPQADSVEDVESAPQTADRTLVAPDDWPLADAA